MKKTVAQQNAEMWGSLNDRQKMYMGAIYEQECVLAAHWLSYDAMHVPKAGEWRWIGYNSAHSQLLASLRRAKLVDPGTGITFSALEERGLIERRWLPSAIPGDVMILQVRLTKTGRAMVKAVDEADITPEEIADSLRRKAFGKVSFRGHDIPFQWETTEGTAVLTNTCKRCSMIVRIDPAARVKDRINGDAVVKNCPGPPKPSAR